jgi:hypothetical protein
MNTSDLTLPDLAQWGLSAQAMELLAQEPDILTDLAAVRGLPPLPPGYVPTVVEVLFDDLPYLRSVEGVVTVVRDCLPDYQPAYVEYRLDDETAFFQAGREIVINRIDGMAQIQRRQGLCH